MYSKAANRTKGRFYLNVNSKLLKCHTFICLFTIFEILIISTSTTKNNLFNPWIIFLKWELLKHSNIRNWIKPEKMKKEKNIVETLKSLNKVMIFYLEIWK